MKPVVFSERILLLDLDKFLGFSEGCLELVAVLVKERR